MDALVGTLQRFGIPFTTVTMLPSGTLSPDPSRGHSVECYAGNVKRERARNVSVPRTC